MQATLRLILWPALLALPATAWADAGFARVQVRELSAAGQLQPPADDEQYPPGGAAYNLARTYSAGAQDYLLLLSGISGRGRVVRLDAAGNLGDSVQFPSFPFSGWRGADIVGSRLYLFRPRDGLVMSFAISAAGVIDTSPASAFFVSGMPDKTLFDAFDQSGETRLFGADTFTGDAQALRASDFAQLGHEIYSLGWTNTDHLTLSGHSYRLLYKQSGHPFQPSALNGAQAGRRAIIELGANGMQQSSLTDTTIGAGWTTVRFYPRGDSNLGVLAYNLRSGAFASWSILPSSGTSIANPGATIVAGFDEVLSYRRSGKTFVVGVVLDNSTDNQVKLTGDPISRFAQCVEQNLEGRAAGYQVEVLQGGRELLNRAEGYRQLSPSVQPMTRYTRTNIGSVGKMFTAVTTLKLADQGLDLQSPFTELLDPQKYDLGGFDPWTEQRTVIDLLAHSTGRGGGGSSDDEDDGPEGCTEVGNTLTVDCTPFFTSAAEDACLPQGAPVADGQLLCPRHYVNAHFGALRQVIEGYAGVETTQEVDALTRSLWLDDVLQGNAPSCFADSTSRYLNPCKVGNTCYSQGGRSWVQDGPENHRYNGWSRSCGAGGWEGSARDLAAILEALRAQQILSSQRTAMLFDTGYTDANGSGTAMAWEPPYAIGPNGDQALGKNGGTSGTRAYVVNLDGNTQAALHLNTSRGVPSPNDVVDMAYRYALDPLNRPCRTLHTLVSRQEVELGSATAVAMVPLSFDRFVTAHYDDTHSLQLVAWDRNGDAIAQTHAISISNTSGMSRLRVLPLSANRFVVALRSAAGTLDLYHLQLSSGGLLAVLDVDHGGAVNDLALAELHLQGADFALVTRNGQDRLEVRPWEIGAGNQLLAKTGSYLSSGTVEDVSAVRGAVNGTLMVAFRSSAHTLKTTAFVVSSDGGTVSRGGSCAEADELSGGDVRITRVEAGGQSYFVTAMRDPDDKLLLATWTVSANLQTITRTAQSTYGTIDRLGNALATGPSGYLAVPMVNGGKAYVKIASLTASGGLVSEVSESDGVARTAAMLLSAGGGRIFATTAYPHADSGSGPLRLVNWELFTGSP